MRDDADEPAERDGGDAATGAGERSPPDTAETALAAVVGKPRTEAAIESLRAEGVYDESRRVREYGDDAAALPVVDPPRRTRVREVVRQEPARRLRTLEDHLRERGWTDAELARAPGS